VPLGILYGGVPISVLSGRSVSVLLVVFIAVTWKLPTPGIKTGEVTPSQLTS
jgi:hypothetical protein